jgi:hypothetical protein
LRKDGCLEAALLERARYLGRVPGIERDVRDRVPLGQHGDEGVSVKDRVVTAEDLAADAQLLVDEDNRRIAPRAANVEADVDSRPLNFLPLPQGHRSFRPMRCACRRLESPPHVLGSERRRPPWVAARRFPVPGFQRFGGGTGRSNASEANLSLTDRPSKPQRVSPLSVFGGGSKAEKV